MERMETENKMLVQKHENSNLLINTLQQEKEIVTVDAYEVYNKFDEKMVESTDRWKTIEKLDRELV